MVETIEYIVDDYIDTWGSGDFPQMRKRIYDVIDSDTYHTQSLAEKIAQVVSSTPPPDPDNKDACFWWGHLWRLNQNINNETHRRREA